MDEERNGDAGGRPKWPWLIRIQALYWFAELQDDSFTMEQWDAFETWLFADERHLAAYEALNRTYELAKKLKWHGDPGSA
jgi:ferric-dicitrate binding protein FerR (iron transport regulator)